MSLDLEIETSGFEQLASCGVLVFSIGIVAIVGPAGHSRRGGVGHRGSETSLGNWALRPALETAPITFLPSKA